MIFLSASQLETVELCARKSFLKSVAKMPEVQTSDSALFGTVLHAVCERYLLGEPDLYPDGWDSDGGVRLDPRDSVLIRLLVDRAIESGYLERRFDGQVEQEFRLQFDHETVIVGFIDYETEDRVEDHKTSKSERYLKSADGLKTSIQMMLYAYKKLEDAKKRGVVLESVTLCHNQYLRDYDDPRVRRRETEVTRQEILTFWESTIVPLVLRAKNLRTLQNPFDIPDPPQSACRAFGGCAFVSICGGQETCEQYRKRLQPKPMSEIKPILPKDFLARRSAKATPAVNPPAAPAPAPVAQTPAALEPAPTSSAPPWWNAENGGCPVCKQNPGFSSKGTPCRICTGKTKVLTDGYEWRTEPNGKVIWWKAGEAPVTSSPVTATVEDGGLKRTYGLDDLYSALAKSIPEEIPALVDKAARLLGEGSEELKVFLASVEEKANTAAVPTAAASPSEPPPKVVVQETAPAPETKKGKKSLEGFTILVGALPLKGFDKVIYCEDFLAGIEGYWKDPDVWGRRGKVANSAANHAERLRGSVLVQRSNDPDCTNLVTALMPHAKAVVQTLG